MVRFASEYNNFIIRKAYVYIWEIIPSSFSSLVAVIKICLHIHDDSIN